jgi:hypothetical protein
MAAAAAEATCWPLVCKLSIWVFVIFHGRRLLLLLLLIKLML